MMQPRLSTATVLRW
jgi:hypothetical protein